jgi:hypothetical protein
MRFAYHHRSGPRPIPRDSQEKRALLAQQILRIADDVDDAIARARLLQPELDHAEPAGPRTFCFHDGSILRISGAQVEAYTSSAELEQSATAGTRLNGVAGG